MWQHPQQCLLGAGRGCSNSFLPYFFSSQPPLSNLLGKKPYSGSVPPSFGFPTPCLSRAGLFTHLPAAVPTLLPGARMPPSFFWLYCEGLPAQGTLWRGYLTKSAGKRLKIQVAALKAFPLPVPFLSTDKVVTIMFVRYEFSLLKISCPLANRFRRTPCFFFSLVFLGFFLLFVCLLKALGKLYKWLPASSGSLLLVPSSSGVTS